MNVRWQVTRKQVRSVQLVNWSVEGKDLRLGLPGIAGRGCSYRLHAVLPGTTNHTNTPVSLTARRW